MEQRKRKELSFVAVYGVGTIALKAHQKRCGAYTATAASQSKAGEVRSALEKAGVQRGIVSQVSYAIPRRPVTEIAIARKLPMIIKEHRPFPYLFKDASYRFEEEIRFVFGTSSESILRGDGVLFDLNPVSFVGDVWIAPGTVESERTVITALWNNVKSGRPLSYPWAEEAQRTNQFPAANQPFSTKRDDCGDLFRDLSSDTTS
jgi:hypothetical protein